MVSFEFPAQPVRVPDRVTEKLAGSSLRPDDRKWRVTF